MNKQTDGWTDAWNRIRCILALKLDVWCKYFNDIPDNQLTKFCVCIGWSQIFYPSLKFLQSTA